MMIETARLIVRTFREEDAEALYRIKTDPQVMKYCPDLLCTADDGPETSMETNPDSSCDCCFWYMADHNSSDKNLRESAHACFCDYDSMRHIRRIALHDAAAFAESATVTNSANPKADISKEKQHRNLITGAVCYFRISGSKTSAR